MLLIRRFEERASQLYGQGLIGGFCHLYIGQEAVAVGVKAAKEERDTMVTAYRDHGHMLVSGMDPGRVMAELTGRATGSSKGKGGSMHMFDPDKGFLGGHGIVGAQVPLGTGVAFAQNIYSKMLFAWSLWGMALPIKGKFTKPSIWQHFGIYLWSM